MFNQTVTIYNKTDNDRYFRTILTGVFWDSSEGAISRKTGRETADGLQLVIPLTGRSGYTPPKEWESLTDKVNHWTAKAGDTVLLGVGPEIEKSIRELQKFDDTRIIIHADRRSYGGGMAHIEVTGR